MDDIDPGKVEAFVRLAKSRRGFPLEEKSPVRKILHHLDLLEGDKIIDLEVKSGMKAENVGMNTHS